MRAFGLIGYPLSHSFSPRYFANKFATEGISDASYTAFPMESVDELPALIANNPELVGLNVTIPHKESVIPLLDSLDADAAAVGAVNTIKLIREGDKIITKGYNTDIIGFRQSLRPLLKQQHYKALILGTGGAAKAVAHVLKTIGLTVLYVSRNPTEPGMVRYEDLNAYAMDQFKLIVNTTPLGTSPNTDTFPPIPYEHLGEEHLLYDLVYNPAETAFMAKGKAQGAIVKNGLQMLEFQAEASWEVWVDAAGS